LVFGVGVSAVSAMTVIPLGCRGRHVDEKRTAALG
jgi:hypothetical protein